MYEIPDDINIIEEFYYDEDVIIFFNKILNEIDNNICIDTKKLIKEYIITKIIANILVEDYNPIKPLSIRHHLAIRLRASNILKKLQINKLLYDDL
jgi:hypothetical protein